nr:MAG TPA: hypothetical protein [Bacteriophage sp.]
MIIKCYFIVNFNFIKSNYVTLRFDNFTNLE